MDNLPLTEFDIATSGTYIQMLKAYLPYTGLKEQKTLSIAIRIVELIQTINFYRNLTEPSPLYRANHDKENMLKEIRKFCPGKDFEILDMISNYSNMNNIISAFQMAEDAKESGNNNELFKKFMSKDQQDLFESYKKILNS